MQLAVVLLAALGLWAYGPGKQPIIGDRAYEIYGYQAFARGQPVYRVTNFGYPPVSGIVAAAGMRAGKLAGIPTYIMPRVMGIAVALASVALLFSITLVATQSALAAALAALSLAGIGLLAELSVTNLEPKALVILLMLAATWCVQRNRWLMTGVAAMLAMTTHYGGAVVVIAAFILALAAIRRTRVPLFRYLTGCVIAILPTVLYLLITSSFSAFLQQTVFLQSENNPVLAALMIRHASRMVRVVLYGGYATEVLLFIVAFIGFVTFTVRAKRAREHSWLDTRYGGIPLLTVGWMLFVLWDFDGPIDLLPVLPLLCFWAGTLMVWHADASRRRKLLRYGIGAAWVAYLFVDAFFYRPPYTLPEQTATIRNLTGSRFAAIGAPEVYVLSETAAPLSHLEVTAAFASREWTESGGCARLMNAGMVARYDVFVLRKRTRPAGCNFEAGGLDGFSADTLRFPLESRRRHVIPQVSTTAVTWIVFRPR